MSDFGSSNHDLSSLRERLRVPFDELTHRNWQALGFALLAVVLLSGWALKATAGGSSAHGAGTGGESSLPQASVTTTMVGATTPSGVVVQVSGAVLHPGVYTLTASERVTDLVQKAGGLTPDADLDRLNLAARLTDGQRLYVLHAGQAAPPVDANAENDAGADPANAIVNLNTATLTQLDALPGVGPSTAQAILDYRKTNGSFKSVADLAKVRGIGPAKLATIKAHVTV